MKFPKDIATHILKEPLKVSVFSFIKYFFYSIYIMLEIVFRWILNFLIKLLFVLPIFVGWLLLKISFFKPFFFFFKFLYLLIKGIFFMFFQNIYKFFLIFLFLFFSKTIFFQNKDLGWSNKFWFNNYNRTNNLEIDFIEYNRSLSKLINRKNFKPSHLFISEKGITENFSEFKLKIFYGIPKYKPSQKVSSGEIFYRSAAPVLYKIDIDYSDFEFLSKYIVSEIDLKTIFQAKHHKQTYLIFFKSFFKFFNYFTFKNVFDLNNFYNFNSFLRNYHDSFLISRNKFRKDDFFLLGIKQNKFVENIKYNNISDLFYSSTSFWDRFGTKNVFFFDSGAEQDETIGNSLYTLDLDEVEYPNKYYFEYEETTFLTYYFFGPTAHFRIPKKIKNPAYTRTYGFPFYDFELSERFFFWHFNNKPLSFGNDKYNYKEGYEMDNLDFSRYGVMGPLINHNWLSFYPYPLNFLIDKHQMFGGNFSTSYFKFSQDFFYTESLFKTIIKDFMHKKVRSNLKILNNDQKLFIKNFPPFLKSPNFRREIDFYMMNQIQGPKDFNTLKYLQVMPKYPYFSIKKQVYNIKKTNPFLWKLKFGKLKHELLWSSKVLSPINIGPTKKRMTTGDFWVLRRSFLRGFMNVKEVYFLLKNNKIINFLRNLENNFLFFIFNILPSDLFFVELKYIILEFLLNFSFLDQFLYFLTYLLKIDFLEVKWFLVRIFIILSDIYLWFILAYVKIISSIFVNILFDDLCGFLIYFKKIFSIYYVDGFLPLKTSITSRQDYLYTESYFKKKVNGLSPKLHVFRPQSILQKKRLTLSRNWLRPTERGRKNLYGFYFKTRFRLLFYDLYHRPPYRRKTSFTWRRGNTIIFGYGGKWFYRDYNSKKRLKLKRLMRYKTSTTKKFVLRRLRMRPFFNYYPNYNFLRFNNHYGLRNQYYNSNNNILFLFEKSQFFNMSSLDLLFKNSKQFKNLNFFNSIFSSSLRPHKLIRIFKHFYFFNKSRSFSFFSKKKRSLYKYDFHYIPYSGFKISNNKVFSLPFLDLLQNPNQYLMKQPNRLFWYFKLFKYFSGIEVYNPKIKKTNYYPTAYKYSPVNQYKQSLFFLNWAALMLHGFYNSTAFFYPTDFYYLSVLPLHPTFLKRNELIFNVNKLYDLKNLLKCFFTMSSFSYFSSKIYSNLNINMQNFFTWSIGDYVNYWNYTSPYMERNFIDFFWFPITSVYTARFLDDGLRLENGINLTYNSIFQRFFFSIFEKQNYNKKEFIIFAPGTGVEPLENFFWTHNQHDFDLYYTLKYNDEWPRNDLKTLTDERFLNIYTQNFRNRVDHFKLNLIKGTSRTLEIDSGISLPKNKFREIKTYYRSKLYFLHSYKRSKKTLTPYKFQKRLRLTRFQYKATSARKITLFLIIVWYKFLFDILKFLIFIFCYYFFENLFIYLFILFLLFNLKCIKLFFNSFFKQERNLVIWFEQRMLLYEINSYKIDEKNFLNDVDFENFYGYSKKELYDKYFWLSYYLPNFFNFVNISKEYKYLRNILIFIYFINFKKIYKKLFIEEYLNSKYLIFKYFRTNNKYNFFQNYIKIFLIRFLKICFNYSYIYNYFYKIFYAKFLNKNWYKTIFSTYFFKFIFLKILNVFKKTLFFLFWLISFSIFCIISKDYLILKNIYLTELTSLSFMFVFILFFIWFFSIFSKKFQNNFMKSAYPIDQYLQDYTTDFIGEAFVYEDSLFFYMQPFQEDEIFDADSFPFYYVWFTQFIGTNFMWLYFAKKIAEANLEAQKEQHELAGFGHIAEDSEKIQGTPKALSEGITSLFYHVKTTLLRQKDIYRFNIDVSLLHEYEESLKTVTNLTTKINYNKKKNFKKFDLPWEIVDGFLYNQYLSNTFWYYHSELFFDTDRLLFLDNAETSTDYNEMMLLEIKGDIPTEPTTSMDLFEGLEGFEVVEYDTEDYEIDDVPVELLDFSEEFGLKKMFEHYEYFFKSKQNYNHLLNYNFYFNNDISETLIVNKSGWINEVLLDRFLFNIVTKDFLFPADNEILSFISLYFDDLKITKKCDDTLLQTLDISFREFMFNFMLLYKPTNIYKHNIYSSQTFLNLAKRLNYKKIPYKKLYLNYLKKFPKNRIPFYEVNQKITSLRWDKGVDLSIALYHPHDVLFKITKNIGLFNFSPYNFNSNKIKFNVVPILGYEIFDNKYKKLFFSNVSFFINHLKLNHYPDLTLSEAERLWIFLGCNRKSWEKKDIFQKDSVIFPYDDWDFPFILISFLFAIHYHRSMKMRGSIASRGGAPFGIIFTSRFQVIKRTEKRQKWRKKRLLKPYENSPLYYFIDFFDFVISFFENLIFNQNKSLFFSKNLFFSDLYVVLFEFYLLLLFYFYLTIPFFEYQINFSNFFLFFENIFFICYFFVYLLFLNFYLLLNFFFSLIQLNKLFIWIKFSFFFFLTFNTIIFFFFFNNVYIYLFFYYFFNFFGFFFLSELLNYIFLFFYIF